MTKSLDDALSLVQLLSSSKSQLRENYISLCGSILTSESPHDIDILIIPAQYVVSYAIICQQLINLGFEKPRFFHKSDLNCVVSQVWDYKFTGEYTNKVRLCSTPIHIHVMLTPHQYKFAS